MQVLLQPFARMLELLALPGRAGAVVDLTLSERALAARLLLYVSGQSAPDAASEVVHLRDAHVTGGTGTGKSTLLARVAEHELAAGRRVVLVDVHQRLAALVTAFARRRGRRWAARKEAERRADEGFALPDDWKLDPFGESGP